MRTELFNVFFVLRIVSGPRMKFLQRKISTPTLPVVYTTDRSKAVVPMLFLFCVALKFTLRGASCLVLHCSLSMYFFCIFSILITLLGEDGAGLCAYCAFVC